MLRLARRKAERRLAVFGCIRSADLPMKGMFFQKRIVFFLFQPVWRARALLVPGRQVARGRFTQRFRLGAFQGNDFLRHDLCYSFSAVGAGCSSSSVSGASSSVKPKREVTDCRTRDAL